MCVDGGMCGKMLIVIASVGGFILPCVCRLARQCAQATAGVSTAADMCRQLIASRLVEQESCIRFRSTLADTDLGCRQNWQTPGGLGSVMSRYVTRTSRPP